MFSIILKMILKIVIAILFLLNVLISAFLYYYRLNYIKSMFYILLFSFRFELIAIKKFVVIINIIIFIIIIFLIFFNNKYNYYLFTFIKD